MKRTGAWLLLTLATLYTLFVIALIFVGCFTTAHIFPSDHDGSKAGAFAMFSFFFGGALWGGGALALISANDDEAS